MEPMSCNIVVEKLDKSGISLSSLKYSSSSFSLGRDQKGIICFNLNLKSRDITIKVAPNSLKVFAKFMKQGKASLSFCDKSGMNGGPKRILISNAAPNDLEKALKLLMVKHHCQQDRMSQLKKPNIGDQIDEISPLRPKELDAVNKKINQKCDKTPTKDKTPIRRLKKRRLAAEEKGIIQKRLTTPKKILSEKKVPLNTLQQDVINRSRRGESVFFTGAAGTGKSFVLKELIKSLQRETTAVTASTGCAAVHVEGQTLHGWAGVGIEIRSMVEVISKIKNNKKLLKNWLRTETLIIDEISMVEADYFDYLEAIARQLKDLKKPFGGIQLILCGDFLQLPPISRDKSKPAKFAFQAQSWSDCITSRVELREVYRQSSDPEFCKLLTNIRVGQVPGWAQERFKESFGHNTETKNGLLPTRLMTHNKQVDQVNISEFELLKTAEVISHARDSVTNDKIIAMIDKVFANVPRVLRMKKGAQVMLTRNISVSNGLVNGSRGVITGFRDGGQPVVKFHAGDLEMPIKLEIYRFDMGDATITRTQYPLVLAWALSIHKSQGMSLDLATVSLAKCFEAGQAYVALSRVRSFAGLRVLDYDTPNIRANPAALKFHNF